MLTKNTDLPPFLSFHSIAATRGDGLHLKLLALFNRLTPSVNEKARRVPRTSSGVRSQSKSDFQVKDDLAHPGIIDWYWIFADPSEINRFITSKC